MRKIRTPVAVLKKSNVRSSGKKHSKEDVSSSSSKRQSVQSKDKQRSESAKLTTSVDVSRRTRRFKNGAKALKEIKAMQRTTSLLIPKASFCRLVREILNMYRNDIRIQSLALGALQEAAEMYMVQFFEDSILCTLHSKRVTLMPSDCHLVRRLRGAAEVCNK